MLLTFMKSNVMGRDFDFVIGAGLKNDLDSANGLGAVVRTATDMWLIETVAMAFELEVEGDTEHMALGHIVPEKLA